MIEENGMLGFQKKEVPPPPPTAPPLPPPPKEAPKLFSPDKMSKAELIGAGAVMLGNIAFVSWWAMNQDSNEIAEPVESPKEITPVLTVSEPVVSPVPQETTPVLEVAEVKQAHSFKEAFDEARAQVGPGGIFEWRGQWYNTYTAEEWKEMASEAKHEYATLVKPFVENEGHESGVFSPQELLHHATTGDTPQEEIAQTTDTPHDLHPPFVNPHASPLDSIDDLLFNT